VSCSRPSRSRPTLSACAPFGRTTRTRTVTSPAFAGRTTFARFHVAASSGRASDARHGQRFAAEGTVLFDGTPRLLQIDGIPLEAQLDGTILYLRNRDEPGVIGQVGTMLGKYGVNIATFALGRREATAGAQAVSLVRLDGEVFNSILEPIKGIPAITEAKLLRLN